MKNPRGESHVPASWASSRSRERRAAYLGFMLSNYSKVSKRDEFLFWAIMNSEDDLLYILVKPMLLLRDLLYVVHPEPESSVTFGGYLQGKARLPVRTLSWPRTWPRTRASREAVHLQATSSNHTRALNPHPIYPTLSNSAWAHALQHRFLTVPTKLACPKHTSNIFTIAAC